MSTQNEYLHIMAIGAHPDDCELHCGGIGALWARQGHKVVFVSVTNGQSGHHKLAGPQLVSRRKAEAKAAGDVAGIESRVLPLPDGYLESTPENRLMLIRLIREYQPDLILTNRPNDYHPDHRYTSQLVKDAAYSLTVPNIAPDVPALKRDPVILYWRDNFQKPVPFKPDIAINIDPVWKTKVQMAHQHTSQFYEFIAWMEGNLGDIPSDEEGRIHWLEHTFLASRDSPPTAQIYREFLIKRYGENKAKEITHAEAFEQCEYGSVLDDNSQKRLFVGF